MEIMIFNFYYYFKFIYKKIYFIKNLNNMIFDHYSLKQDGTGLVPPVAYEF